jgi:3-hydroxyacyl-CoA dehydrogenase
VVNENWKEEEVVVKNSEIMKEIGKVNVWIKREIEGFEIKRIKYRILNEEWRIVDDGILNVKEIENVM